MIYRLIKYNDDLLIVIDEHEHNHHYRIVRNLNSRYFPNNIMIYKHEIKIKEIYQSEDYEEIMEQAMLEIL